MTILPEATNSENIASNGPGDEHDVSPGGRLGHTAKAARTILVSDSVGLALYFGNLQSDTLEGPASIAENVAGQGVSFNVHALRMNHADT